MKMWQFINKVKKTDATPETIYKWHYTNNIYPIDTADELEINDEDAKEKNKRSCGKNF